MHGASVFDMRMSTTAAFTPPRHVLHRKQPQRQTNEETKDRQLDGEAPVPSHSPSGGSSRLELRRLIPRILYSGALNSPFELLLIFVEMENTVSHPRDN